MRRNTYLSLAGAIAIIPLASTCSMPQDNGAGSARLTRAPLAQEKEVIAFLIDGSRPPAFTHVQER